MYKLPQAQSFASYDLPTSGPSIAPIDASSTWAAITNEMLKMYEEKTAEASFREGVEAQTTQGSEESLVEAPGFSFQTSNKAFQQGRNQVFKIQKSAELENKYNEFLMKNEYDPVGFKKSAEEFNVNFKKNIPIEMAADFSLKISQLMKNSELQIQQKVKQKTFEQDKAVIQENINRTIENYGTLIAQGQLKPEERQTKQQEFLKTIVDARNSGFIKPDQFFDYLKQMENTAIVSNHQLNMSTMTADQQFRYIKQLEDQNINADGTTVDPASYTDEKIGSIEQKNYVLSKLKSVYSKSREEENFEYKTAEDNLALMKIKIEQGESIDPNQFKNSLATMMRINPSAADSQAENAVSLFNARNRIASEVGSVNNEYELIEKHSQLKELIRNGYASPEDELVYKVMNKKMQHKFIQTPYVQSAGVVVPAFGQQPISTVQRTQEVVREESQTGIRKNFLTPQDHINLIQLASKKSEPEKGIQSGLYAAANTFNGLVPADRKHDELRELAKTNPTTAIQFSFAEYAGTNDFAKKQWQYILSGNDIPDGKAAAEVKKQIKENLNYYVPMIKNNPAAAEAYANIGYMIYKAKGADDNNVNSAIVQEISDGLFGVAEPIKINNLNIPPMEPGLSQSQVDQIWKNTSVDVMAKRAGGYPVISINNETVKLDDRAKDNLKLFYVGPQRYAMGYQLPDGKIVQVYNSTNAQPFIYNYKRNDKMIDIVNPNNIQIPGAMPNIVQPRPIQQPIQPIQQNNIITAQEAQAQGLSPTEFNVRRMQDMKMAEEQRKNQLELQKAERQAEFGVEKTAKIETNKAAQDQIINIKSADPTSVELQLNSIINDLNTGALNTGALRGYETIQTVRGIVAETTGIGEKQLTAEQNFESVANAIALDIAQAMKGSFSDRDINFVKSQTLSLSKTKDYNIRKLAGLKAANDRLQVRKEIVKDLEQNYQGRPGDLMREVERRMGIVFENSIEEDSTNYYNQIKKGIK